MLKQMGRNRKAIARGYEKHFGILGTGASESGLKPGNEVEGTVALWELLWGAAGGAIGAYGSSYFGKAGELAAIRGGLDTIKLQVTATAEATKAVEQRFSRADLVGSAEFEFRRQQLTELYGPLYATLKTTKELYDLWMAHKIPEVNGPFKLLLATKNKMSRDLITQKAYLIEGGRMPESFTRFVTSTTIWDLYAAPTPDGVVPKKLAEDKHSKFPEDFVDHVYEVTEKLKARLAALYSAYAIQTPSAMGPAPAISPLD